MRHLKITVYGRVQGVFFRASTQDRAIELGLNGWCKNQRDGSVYIEVEGDTVALDQFLSWCHQGPELSRVDRLEVVDGEIEGFTNFRIKRF